jgi:ribosomal protein S18 acetylase RimI-like enzyme
MTADILLADLATVDRMLAVDIAYTVSRMRVLERIPGNPVGIAFHEIDATAMALMSRYLPAFNRVIGLRAGHETKLDTIAGWYRLHGVRPTFEMIPGQLTPDLGRELTRLGFFQSGFHAALVGAPEMRTRSANQDGIVRVRTPDEMERYLNAYVAGWGIPPDNHAQFKANVRPWPKEPGWSLYVAEAEGRPAAAATLYVHDGVGYLADAATDPAMRGRGLQRALLDRRIADAATQGVDFVFSGAAPFSISHRNMERVGLRVAFMRSLWTPD